MNIFEFALKKEAQSQAVYLELAKAAPTIGMKNIFTMLADDEKRHYQTIVKMEKEENVDLSECKILADSRKILAKFRAEKMKFKLDSSQLDAYKKAQESEDTSEAFYREKAHETKDEYQRKLFLSLAEEENNHSVILNEIIELIGHPEAFLENAEFNKR
ncbi:MAG: ferritin family protein [Candidatus Ozemobacteraceae bacterium]